MNLRLEFKPRAQEEFDDAADWYFEQEPDLKVKFVAAVDAAIAAIVQRPHSFPIIYGSRIRQASVKKFPYVLIFTEEIGRILVYSVFHTSRNPLNWRGRIE